jgi:hypothetical protein
MLGRQELDRRSSFDPPGTVLDNQLPIRWTRVLHLHRDRLLRDHHLCVHGT